MSVFYTSTALLKSDSIYRILVFLIVIFVSHYSINQALAAIPELIPVEDYRDFIPFGFDPLHPDRSRKRDKKFTKLLYVDAIAARGNDIYIADTSQRIIFRLDRIQHSLTEFAFLQGGVTTDLYVASDLSVYVIDRFNGQVIQYSQDGRKIRTFGDKTNLASPVAITESDKINRVLIADNVNGYIAVFNKLGGLSGITGQNINIPNPASSITDMITVDGIIYLLDQLSREVSVIDIEGRPIYKMGSLQLKKPVAMAVDYCQRIFVADQFDNSIHVFHDKSHMAVFENKIFGLIGFDLITDIWIDNELLYISDGSSGYIKVMKIEGDCS